MATAKTRLIRCRLGDGGWERGQRVGPLEHPSQHRGQDDGGDGQVAHRQQAGGEERHHRHHVAPAQAGPDQQEQGQHQEHEGETAVRALEVGRHPLDDPLEHLPLVAQGEREGEQLGAQGVDHRHHQPDREPAHVAHGVAGPGPPVEGLAHGPRPQPRQAEGERAVAADPEPHHGYEQPLAAATLDDRHRQHHADGAEEQGSGPPERRPEADDDQPAEGGPQRRPGPHQPHDQPHQQGDEQRPARAPPAGSRPGARPSRRSTPAASSAPPSRGRRR